VIEQPSDLAGRKIGVQSQPGFALHPRLVPGFAQRGASAAGAPVLPDDGAPQRCAAAPLPQQRGFALVRDADGGKVLGAQPGAGQGLAGAGQLRGPDLVRAMLDPARLWVVLADFLLRLRPHLALGVEHDAARTGGALV